MTRFLTFFFLCLGMITHPSSYCAKPVNDCLGSISHDPNALYVFFKKMPKGGELHYHLAGGAYPETMLELANRQTDYCLNKQNYSIEKSTSACAGVPSSEILLYPQLYNKTIRAWSMKDFIPGKESGHDHFFASFYKFMPIISDHRPSLLAEIMQRAFDQNELYLEVMILPDNAKSSIFAKYINKNQTFPQKQSTLLKRQDFKNNIQHTIEESHRILTQAKNLLGCDKQPKKEICRLKVKFQYYILREQPLDAIFAQALNGFAAAANSPDIAGINLVQEEDSPIALRDYHKQMQILNFLHTQYPTVHIALHAGELAFESVMPESLRFHIRDAIITGKAERIGHGVDIAHENFAEETLKQMATTPIPVEINLTSNKKILNIYGKYHPLLFYINHHVPIVLSTDDEGILRTDLTQQFVEAVLIHGLSYQQIKAANRNVLTYSFLTGQSIWQDAEKSLPVPACKKFDSKTCLAFIRNSEKAQLQWLLEKKLTVFERQHKQCILN